MACAKKALRWSVQVLGRTGADNFCLQLPCALLKGLATHLLCLRYVVASEDARIPVLNSTSALVSSHCYRLLHFIYQPMDSYTKLEYCVKIRGLQMMFIWYLKWKFKLFSTGLCSMVYVRWVVYIFISVRSLDINQNYKVNWFCEGKVHNQIAIIFRRSNIILSSTIWLFTKLPETPVYMGSCRLLFDRGKIIVNVMKPLYKHPSFGFQALIYLPGMCHGSSKIRIWLMESLQKFFYVRKSRFLCKAEFIQSMSFAIHRKLISCLLSCNVTYVHSSYKWLIWDAYLGWKIIVSCYTKLSCVLMKRVFIGTLEKTFSSFKSLAREVVVQAMNIEATGSSSVRNVTWISVTSFHFYMGQIDCKQDTLAVNDKVIMLHRRQGQAANTRIFQAVRLLIRYDNCMNVSASRVTSLYSAPSASGCGFKEGQRDISTHALDGMKKHENMGYIEVFLSSAHIHTTVLDEIMKISKGTHLSGLLTNNAAVGVRGIVKHREVTMHDIVNYFSNYFYIGRMPIMLTVRQMPRVLTVLTVDSCLSLLGLEMWCSGPHITVLVSASSLASLQPPS